MAALRIYAPKRLFRYSLYTVFFRQTQRWEDKRKTPPKVPHYVVGGLLYNRNSCLVIVFLKPRPPTGICGAVGVKM